MRGYLFLPSVVLCLVLMYMPTTGISEGDGTAEPNGAEERHNHTDTGSIAGEPTSPTIPESQNQIVKLSDRGIEPSVLHMKKEDSIAFFLNDSTDSLVTLAINFGKLPAHCSSSNMKIGDDGMIRSTRPVGPKDFASTCFHDRGTYNYTVYGLKGDPQGVEGSIVVE
jgi:hypothetical protein